MRLRDRIRDAIQAHKDQLQSEQKDKPKGSLMLWIMLVSLVINFLRWRQGK